MNANKPILITPIPGRVASVDFFRGVTMFLLAGESSRLYGQLLQFDNGFMHFFGTQLEHQEWHGLHFWDLIQPFLAQLSVTYLAAYLIMNKSY